MQRQHAVTGVRVSALRTGTPRQRGKCPSRCVSSLVLPRLLGHFVKGSAHRKRQDGKMPASWRGRRAPPRLPRGVSVAGAPLRPESQRAAPAASHASPSPPGMNDFQENGLLAGPKL